MGDRFRVNYFFYLHMHSHAIASTGETAVGGVGAWKQVCAIVLKFGIFGIF